MAMMEDCKKYIAIHSSKKLSDVELQYDFLFMQAMYYKQTGKFLFTDTLTRKYHFFPIFKLFDEKQKKQYLKKMLSAEYLQFDFYSKIEFCIQGDALLIEEKKFIDEYLLMIKNRTEDEMIDSILIVDGSNWFSCIQKGDVIPLCDWEFIDKVF